MKPAAETFLWESIERNETPRDTIQKMIDLGIIRSPKQAWATLEKWCRQNCYEYGVCLDLGWAKSGKVPRGIK